ncbi:hypothetical protein G4V62_00910 [Bacillaceae bacterium SIJ1]|uniref:patatin-like phospholipase family protein n=1 Tax=Litoribacterium kuwaitense TaxID=1398745 RepID=UPI0013EBF713|nr:patatin-like phospholipase family protein [Litoribacterium kuwaitense]NGP43589.1 hypothetical protein [Litoribacterium kuwaitense]
MNVDGVFSGGGIKVIAMVGAIQEVEKQGISFVRTAGTSAGALLAALIAAGYRADELVPILDELNGTTLLEGEGQKSRGGVLRWFKLYFKMGLYKGDALEEWVATKLAQRGVETFQDLPEGALRVVVSDVSKGRMVVLPDDLEHYGIQLKAFPVARAVRMSCTLPFFFQPVQLYNGAGKKSLIVDGGVLSNFPMWLFKPQTTKPQRPVLGIRLTGDRPPQTQAPISNALQLYRHLFKTMQNAHDNRYISQHHIDDIMFLPVSKVQTTDFELSEVEKESLLELGREKAGQFLKTWA